MAARAPSDFEIDRLRRPDGRQVLYYRWETARPPEAEPSPPPPGARPTAGELRWHASLGEWVIVAPERQERTFLPDASACPLCPTRPGSPATELERSEFEIAVFDNRFPPLVQGTPDAEPPTTGLGATAPAHGAAEVVVYSPRHGATLGELSADEVSRLVAVWLHRARELGERRGIAYAFVFENRGEAIGVTLHHPHGQIYGYPFVPPIIAREIEAGRRHRSTTGGCLWCAQLTSDLADERRVVSAAATWVAGVPFAARWPFEVHLTARRHLGSLTDLTPDEQIGLAELLRDLVGRYDTLFGRPLPYVMAVHQSPSDGAPDHHLHVEFYPRHRSADRLKYVAGSEAGAGVFVADILPEVMAARLRDAGR